MHLRYISDGNREGVNPSPRPLFLSIIYFGYTFPIIELYIDIQRFLISKFIIVFPEFVQGPAATTCEKNTMGIRYCHPSQKERLIAAGRVATIALPLVSVYLHPAEHVRHARLINSLLSEYLVYAAVLAAVLWSLVSTWIHLAVVVSYHRADLKSTLHKTPRLIVEGCLVIIIDSYMVGSNL